MSNSQHTVDWDTAPRVREFAQMDRARFEQEIQVVDEPAVLRGLVTHWPAARAAARSAGDLALLLRRHDLGKPIRTFRGPPEIRGRYGYRDDLLGFNFERREEPLDTFLALLEQHRVDPAPPGLYAGAIPVPEHLPGLLSEHQQPLLEPGREQLVSLWLGNRSRTAAHYDLAQNLACVLTGRRRFIVLPITALPNLYVGPLDRTLAGQAISLVDFEEPDFERHPRFREALAQARVAELGPGDALYLPSLWWHHVESFDPFGAMLNFWWRDGPAHLITPMLTMLHALLSLRDLPPREREAWRCVFDHYIFQTGDDPMAHLPAPARGIFGTLDDDKVRRLREHLARSLLGQR